MLSVSYSLSVKEQLAPVFGSHLSHPEPLGDAIWVVRSSSSSHVPRQPLLKQFGILLLDVALDLDDLDDPGFDHSQEIELVRVRGLVCGPHPVGFEFFHVSNTDSERGLKKVVAENGGRGNIN